MREARGRRRKVQGFDYGDGDTDNDGSASDDEDDNGDNGDNSINDVPKLCSSGYKLNCWAIHMCKMFVDDVSIEWLTYMYYLVSTWRQMKTVRNTTVIGW
jgi:hypothetical protein